MKPIKVPQQLVQAPYFHRDIKINDLSIVESCTHTQQGTGSMFLQDHLLLVVLKGTITYGKESFVVHKNEMVVLKKAIQVSYLKVGDPQTNDSYDSLLFFIKDEFINEFIRMANLDDVRPVETAKVQVRPVKERLQKFFESIQPYFDELDTVEPGLIRLKMLELLYDLAHIDKSLLHQMLQLKHQVVSDITSVMEQNYTNPVSLSDLAYLSGRSLSSFKRDFYEIYHTTPAEWIRNKRLEKAKEMLRLNFPVSDVCYSMGFENVAHFSRLFKSYYGISPSQLHHARV